MFFFLVFHIITRINNYLKFVLSGTSMRKCNQNIIISFENQGSKHKRNFIIFIKTVKTLCKYYVFVQW